MKKRLLITSIVMMLVVAVALSTATYAWFTSATEVTASSITMTAGTSTSSALGIAWAASAGTPHTPAFNNGYGTTITAAAPSASTPGFQPAAPNALTDSEPAFYTAFIDAQGKFKSTPDTQTPVYRFNDGENEPSNLIHVANLAASGSVNVNCTATITGTAQNDGASLIRIAIYEVNTVTEPSPATTYTYKGLLGAAAESNNTAVGTITATNSASLLKTESTTVSVSLGPITAQTEKAYAVYVWLDGATFDEGFSGTSASIVLKFATAA